MAIRRPRLPRLSDPTKGKTGSGTSRGRDGREKPYRSGSGPCSERLRHLRRILVRHRFAPRLGRLPGARSKNTLVFLFHRARTH